MNKKFANILVLYKKSAYQIYFLERKDSFLTRKKNFYLKELDRFRQTHEEHYKSLAIIEQILRSKKIKYSKRARGQKLDYSKYDFVITVGGDGTFLEAARHLVHQPMLGVNSDPSWSVGRFCIATIINFSRIIDQILRGKFKVQELSRVKMKINEKKSHVNVLNDLLVCHRNPASMSRYFMTIDGKGEEQKSSGVWIATAAGSTGAIASAGGKAMPFHSSEFQYKPRELYHGPNAKYNLGGGILSPHQSIKIVSLMRSGVVFTDGGHLNKSLPFGHSIVISHSSEPLKIIQV